MSKEWQSVEQDLCGLLEHLKGSAVNKMEKMGEIIYNYRAERFGTMSSTRNPCATKSKSRRQQEIDRLIKGRWLLKKQWRKVSEEEKDELQPEIKSRLATLRRAEYLRKRHREKRGLKSPRAKFFSDPFQLLKSLFTKEKSGKLVT